MLPEVKRFTPVQALDYLMYSPKKSARIYYKAVQSAIENAKNTLKVNADMLQFKLFTIEEGPVMKRFNAGSRGTAKPIKKKFSHIKIVLGMAEVKEAKKEKEVAPKTKVEKKKTVKKSTKKEVEPITSTE
jgi:hypothetical protein